MGTYEIPRNTKGEGRLFYIFSTKALIFTVGGILLGWLLRWIPVLIGKMIPKISGIMSIVGFILIGICAILGFIIGTFKVPAIDKFEITKKAAGIDISKAIWESIKFRLKKSRYYVYDTKELVREEIIRDQKDKQELEEKEAKLRIEEITQNSKNRRGYIQNGR